MNPSPITLSAGQVFLNRAETWTFQNGYGDLTWIDVMPQGDGSTIWHYTKNNPRAYWTPGARDAELWFNLAQVQGGAWYSTGGHIKFPFGAPWDATPQDFSYTVSGDAGKPRPYLIIPAIASNTPTVAVDTTFPDFAPNTPWKTETWVEWVETPRYTGWAMVSKQSEGFCSPVAQCVVEKWYLGIGVGLVKVEQFFNGNPTLVDPLITMVRV